MRGAESDEGSCFTKVRGGRSAGMVFKQRTGGSKRKIWGDSSPGRGNGKVRGARMGASWQTEEQRGGRAGRVGEGVIRAGAMAPLGSFEQTSAMIFLMLKNVPRLLCGGKGGRLRVELTRRLLQ